MISITPSIRAFWDALVLRERASAPAAASGYGKLFVGDDQELYLVKGDGTVVQLTDEREILTGRMGPFASGPVPVDRTFSSPLIATATGTGVGTVNRGYCWPFYLHPGHGFNRIATRIQATEAGRSARVGVIGMTAEGLPDHTVIHADGGTVDLSTGTIKLNTVDLSAVTGWVYVVILFDATLTSGSMFRGLMRYSGIGENAGGTWGANGAGGLYLTVVSANIATSLAACLTSGTCTAESTAMPWVGLQRA